MGVCTLWEPIYMLWQSSAQFSERNYTVWESIYTLWEAADAIWKSIYMLGWAADTLWECASAVIDRRYRSENPRCHLLSLPVLR